MRSAQKVKQKHIPAFLDTDFSIELNHAEQSPLDIND